VNQLPPLRGRQRLQSPNLQNVPSFTRPLRWLVRRLAAGNSSIVGNLANAC
jgi:hypothetical protein